MISIKNLCTKYCCKSINKQSTGVQERINLFYINFYGEIVGQFNETYSVATCVGLGNDQNQLDTRPLK